MKRYVVANWKMAPPGLTNAKNIFDGIKKAAQGKKNTTTVVCPPFVYLHNLRSTVKNLYMGAQDISMYESGAHTGEISAEQLKEARVLYVIVGHSERRAMGETNQTINQKIKRALRYDLKPILCVGELEQGERALNYVRDEILEGLRGVRDTRRILVAYEPVWAISAKSRGRSDTPEHAIRMAAFIRRVLKDSVEVLYGGSVGPNNAKGFLHGGWLSGLLVGSNSLDPHAFGSILDVVERL